MGYNVYSTGVNSINQWDLKTGVYVVVKKPKIKENIFGNVSHFLIILIGVLMFKEFKINEIDEMIDKVTILDEDIKQVSYLVDCPIHSEIECHIDIWDEVRFMSNFTRIPRSLFRFLYLKFPYILPTPIFDISRFIELLKQGEFDNPKFYSKFCYDDNFDLVEDIQISEKVKVHSFEMKWIRPEQRNQYNHGGGKQFRQHVSKTVLSKKSFDDKLINV